MADYIVVDMRLQFGWRWSPEWWGVVASSMPDAQRKQTRATAVILEAGIRAIPHDQGYGRGIPQIFAPGSKPNTFFGFVLGVKIRDIYLFFALVNPGVKIGGTPLT